MFSKNSLCLEWLFSTPNTFCCSFSPDTVKNLERCVLRDNRGATSWADLRLEHNRTRTVCSKRRGRGSAPYPPSMRKIVYLCLVASASAFSTGPLLNSAMPRLRRASAVTSLRARDCIFDQEPCESSGECRVNNAFCDDNHGFHQPGPRQPCARKAAPKISEKVLKIFDEVAAEQKAAKHSTK